MSNFTEKELIELLDDKNLYLYEDKYNEYKNLDNNLSNTLHLFTYGNYLNFINNKANYIKLSLNQLNKLKMLSLLDYSNNKVINYDVILKALDLETIQELEHLVISAINNNLLTAKCNQLDKTLVMNTTINRNLVDITTIKDNLIQYQSNIKSILNEFESVNNSNNNFINNTNETNENFNNLFSSIIQSNKQSNKQSSRKRLRNF